jgi:hypothetical protein
MGYMAFAPRSRMDPPPRSFAPDAHACIMVLVLTDQSNTSLRRENASNAELASVVSPTFKPGTGLTTVKGCVAARWPAATLDRRSARCPAVLRRKLLISPKRGNVMQSF